LFRSESFLAIGSVFESGLPAVHRFFGLIALIKPALQRLKNLGDVEFVQNFMENSKRLAKKAVAFQRIRPASAAFTAGLACSSSSLNPDQWRPAPARG
jgi:hypothetical protein